MTDNDKTAEPKELTEETMIYLAGLTPLQKLQEIRKTAKQCKVPVRDLEKLVKEKTPAPSQNASEMVDVALAERRKQADVLIAIGKKAKLFHTPAPDREAFAHLQIGDHFETLCVRGEFRKWLRHSYFQETKSGCNGEAMQVAIETLAAIAEFEGEEIEVFTRVGEYQGAIYIDLGDNTWRAVEVTAKGWKVIARPPVRFQRSASMRALPAPERGGSINDLRSFVHGKDNNDFVLLASYLAASLRPNTNYPVLIVVGQHGSAKTWTTGLVVRFVDPRKPDRRSMPRTEDDLIVAAKSAHLLSFDNVSRLALEMSDAISRLSTGGGAGKRRLYTDDDEVLFSGRRPVVLNGITDFATQPDLLDRVVMLSQEPLDDAERRDERALLAALGRADPKIFGALLDGLVAGLRTVDQVLIPNPPRMADYALWGEACCRAWWPAGTFIDAYRRNRAKAVELSIEANPVATAVVTFMANRSKWAGTASLLLEALTAVVSERVARSQAWPSVPHVLSGHLRRAAPNLRKIGISVEWSDRKNSVRATITIEKSADDEPVEVRKKASSASPASPDRPPDSDARDARDAVLHTKSGGPRALFSANPLKSQNVGAAEPGVTAKDDGLAVCAVCKKPDPPPNRVAIDGLNVWLHPGCEAAYLSDLANDSSKAPLQSAPAVSSVATNGAPIDAAYQATTEKRPDAVADVPDQAEKAPPAADVISAPDPVPARPMLEGDRRREAIRARNQEALRRAEAELRGRQR